MTVKQYPVEISTINLLADYCYQELEIKKELAQVTIAKYKQQLNYFYNWLGERELSAEMGTLFLAELRQQGYSKVSIRSYYAAIRPFLKWHGIDFTLKLKKILGQTKISRGIFSSCEL